MDTTGLKVAALGVAVALSTGAAPSDGASRAERIASMYKTYSLAFPKVQDVSAAEILAEAPDARPVLVDVRPDDERAVSMIPGAITQTEFEHRLDAFRGQRVVTYCTIGARSGMYANKLRKDGFNVQNLAGSLLAWTHAGGSLVTPEGTKTQRVHVYGKRWNLVAADYVGVIGPIDAQVELPQAR